MTENMKIQTHSLFLTIAISLAFFFMVSNPSYAKENGWILTQHSKIFGDQYTYISKSGVKCVNPKQGIGWITHAPNWNITFFNEKTKLYYPLSSSSWKRKIEKNGLLPTNINWSKVSSGSIAGLKASEYQMVNSNNVNAQTKSAKWLSATYWLADEIKVPSSLAQLISATSGLPTSNSIPLELHYRNQNGTSETLLSTYHQQTTTIPDSYFSAPPGYKMAKSEIEVLISQENRALIDDLANDLTSENPQSKVNPQMIQVSSKDINKLPDQLTLPGGRTVSKNQINKFLEKLKQNN